jgi:Putative Zn-dependent protease, contains TPR repeats
MKKNSAGCFVVMVIFSLFSVMCLSCESTEEIPVPGETQIKLDNITAEYFSIAKGYQDIKNYTKAAEFYKKALASKKLHDSAYYEMGRCYALAKDWNNAELVFSDLQKKDPDNTTIAVSLAYIKAMSGNVSEAVQMYASLVQKNPTDVSLLKNYIAVLMAKGNYEEAEKQYFVLKKKFPDEKSIPDILSKLADNLDNTELLKKENDAAKTVDETAGQEQKK